MDISALQPGTFAQVQQQTTAKTLGKDDFLRLLTTQLQAQNPLKPMESTEFTAQLAQFSSLEQLTGMTTQLKDLVLFQNSIQNTLAAGLIGKKVLSAGSSVSLKDGSAEIIYNLPKDASKVTLIISDAQGRPVKTISLSDVKSGSQSYAWDGRDGAGNKLADGTYTVKVAAVDANGQDVGAATRVTGVVTGITYENNVTYLLIDGKTKIQLGDIVEITA